MAKVICLFNHKGGVSKTTTAFNLGWMLSVMGKRVLLADFDPQCNLTGMVLGFRGQDDLLALYGSSPPNNVKDALAPAFESRPVSITAANCYAVRPDNSQNLLLLPGHIGLSEYETTLGVAQELSGSLLPLRNLPGSIRYMIDVTANVYRADYVLVDMSPSLGPLNQNLIATCDHFIVPLHPDFFSSMALNSLSRALPRWQQWAKTASSIDALRTADYPFPAPRAKFIGSIIQKYRPRNGGASSAFQTWIDRLHEGMRLELIPALEEAGMLDAIDYERRVHMNPWVPLMEVGDFNGLIALSQKHQTPVYALTEQQLGVRGAVLRRMQGDMEKFSAAFRTLANRVIDLTA
ncbi:AAA family ATPase [Stenotrophomonas sp.]|uniref:ParA family protein n=1 Tax=Stenotrophomonas sp. TaxID=69392 RepID=UPI0028998B51|nr:AAA family ATPase [Stenotrophomonas sp.]